MATVINGTDNTAATPALTGTDTDTGVFFPAADTMALSTGGTEQVRVDSAGNVGIGTTVPDAKITIKNPNVSGEQTLLNVHSAINANVLARLSYNQTDDIMRLFNQSTFAGSAFALGTSNTERMRVDSSGNLLVGTTTQQGQITINVANLLSQNGLAIKNLSNNTGGDFGIFFNSANTVSGRITQNGTATVAYTTSSDYRLKENIAPMTGALATVSALKPCTYTWKEDGSDGQGFIAHELQEVCPDAVVGEKDAVDSEGNIKPQGIDTSFLVATLTAAIQELKATVDAQAARIAALENPPVES
jgi:hypothetical protein